MARRRRRSGFELSDLPLIFNSFMFAAVVACCGLAEVIVYYAFEPSIGDRRSPITSLPHIFWEAIAVKFFWPGVAMLCLGILGMVVCWGRDALNRSAF